MPYRTLIAVLSLLLLSGCTVYGNGYERGYSRYPSHHYHSGYRRDYVQPVYITPRYYYHDEHRYDRHRHDGKRYSPALRYQGIERRHLPQHESYSRREGRQMHKQYQAAPSGKHWQGNRQQQSQRYSRDGQHWQGESRRGSEWQRN